jgi:carboxyl-terminal processing protease
LAWDTINPIRHRKYFDIPAVIPALIAKHEQRMETDPDFIFLNDQLQLMEANRKITSLSLNEETRRTLQISIEEKALAIENKRRIAKGLEPLDDLETDESESAADADTADTAASGSDAQDEDKEIGPLLTETGHILLDSLTVYQVDNVAATAKR